MKRGCVSVDDAQPLFIHRLFEDNFGRSLAVFAMLCVAPRSGRGRSDNTVYFSGRRLDLLLSGRKRRLQCRFRSAADQIFGYSSVTVSQAGVVEKEKMPTE